MNFPDIAILNNRFGAPGRIAFRSGEAGLPVVSLANRYGTCEVSLYGGHVLSYRPTGHSPVLFLSKKSLYEPGRPIRGGVPLCWPWFGPSKEAGLPMHGLARIVQWDLRATEYSSDVTELRLALVDSDLTRRYWPFAFELSLRVWIDQRLNIELTTLNRDAQPFTITQAFHPYLLVRDIREVTVLGLDQATFMNTLTRQSGKQEGPLAIRAETDHIFTPLKPECMLHDKRLGRALAMTFSGTPQMVVWNPWIAKAKAMADFGDEEYTSMLCLEPANTAHSAVTLAPGQQHTLALALQATLT
jgi:glucose-6-phosphate 1-epimerase